MSEYDAVVVGAGPNGLTAAARLAVEGWRVLVLEAGPTIGGGCRTAELLEPGVRHDLGAAVLPAGAASPAFRALGLDRHGLVWDQPPLALAHPFDDGDAAVLDRGVDATADGFDESAAGDGDRYRRLVRPLLAHWDGTIATALGPILRIPSAPIAAARFGLVGMPSSSHLVGRFEGRRARALLAGLGAHSFLPLTAPFTAGIGLTLALFAHIGGWPVARGGSQAVVDALAAVITEHGGEIRTGERVRSLATLPPARATLLDVTPRQFVALAGSALTGWTGRPYRRFTYGPGVVKADYVLAGPVPWTSEAARRAGTVHLGGEFESLAAAEAQATSGTVPERPYVLVAQPAVADPSREHRGHRPLWAYCHLGGAARHDPTAIAAALAAMEGQLDRAAPGWRDLLVARHVSTAASLEEFDANLVDGDIAGGAMTVRQLVARPRLALDPYRTPVPGVWLCSASTPPGAGVHGMAGWHAAASVLRSGLAERGRLSR